VRLAISLALLLGCRPAPSPQPTPASEPAPTQREPVAMPPPEPDMADGWCYVEIVELDRRGGATTPTPVLLRERTASTDIVTLVTQTLSQADCTSVGHHHAVYEPVDAKDGSGLVRAYRSFVLPFSPSYPRATHYLLGAQVEPERDVDLSHVCVGWQGRANATPRWLIPIREEAELPVWRTRLAEGLCGRAPLTPRPDSAAPSR